MRCTEFTVEYTEKRSVNYNTVEFGLSASFQLEEGDDYQLGFAQARRDVMEKVRATSKSAALYFSPVEMLAREQGEADEDDYLPPLPEGSEDEEEAGVSDTDD